MNDIHVEDFADMLCFLDPCPEATRLYDQWGTKCKNQKAHMVIWFASQVGTGSGAFTRGKGNDSAQAAYNRLLNAGALVWIADALGEDAQVIQQAAEAAAQAEKVNYRRRCGAFREVIPFSRIVELFAAPQGWRYDPALAELMEFGADGLPCFKAGQEQAAQDILDREFG